MSGVTAEVIEEHATMLMDLALLVRAGMLEAEHDPGADFKFKITDKGRKRVEAMGVES